MPLFFMCAASLMLSLLSRTMSLSVLRSPLCCPLSSLSLLQYSISTLKNKRQKTLALVVCHPFRVQPSRHRCQPVGLHPHLRYFIPSGLSVLKARNNSDKGATLAIQSDKHRSPERAEQFRFRPTIYFCARKQQKRHLQLPTAWANCRLGWRA